VCVLVAASMLTAGPVVACGEVRGRVRQGKDVLLPSSQPRLSTI
jgi:hypothetical protein